MSKARGLRAVAITPKGISVIEQMAMRPGWSPIPGLGAMSAEDAKQVRATMWRKYQYREPDDAWWER